MSIHHASFLPSILIALAACGAAAEGAKPSAGGYATEARISVGAVPSFDSVGGYTAGVEDKGGYEILIQAGGSKELAKGFDGVLLVGFSYRSTKTGIATGAAETTYTAYVPNLTGGIQVKDLVPQAPWLLLEPSLTVGYGYVEGETSIGSLTTTRDGMYEQLGGRLSAFYSQGALRAGVYAGYESVSGAFVNQDATGGGAIYGVILGAAF